jgi:hypothetical protein
MKKKNIIYFQSSNGRGVGEMIESLEISSIPEGEI